MRTELAASLVALAAVVACGGGVKIEPAAAGKLPTLADVTPAQWSGLAQRRIFFGHQSVGQNIVEGIADILREHREIGLRVVESEGFAGAAAFYHAKVGRNGYPLEKIDALRQDVERSSPAPGDVAMVKLCYVDAQPATDAQALFDAYRSRMDSLKRERPGLTIVHFTMPLMVNESWLAVLRKKLRGQWIERDRNVVRGRYNRLLLAHYQAREPVFDIARLESMRPDGSRLLFLPGADTAYALAPEYTSDGGHLNETARRMVAEQLLVYLARLPARPSDSHGS